MSNTYKAERMKRAKGSRILKYRARERFCIGSQFNGLCCTFTADHNYDGDAKSDHREPIEKTDGKGCRSPQEGKVSKERGHAGGKETCTKNNQTVDESSILHWFNPPLWKVVSGMSSSVRQAIAGRLGLLIKLKAKGETSQPESQGNADGKNDEHLQGDTEFFQAGAH